ncbi:hypothetical protein [Parapedobacter koreensis]|nr:hypothetical protein [Parapedobacter koreensis]
MKFSPLVWMVLMVFFQSANTANAQLRFNVYSGGYFNITEYSGYMTPEGSHQFHIQYAGQQINEENWSISARINGPIRPMSGENMSGLPFPADRIRFRFTHDDGNPPTLAEIGVSTSFIPFNAIGETIIIPKSKAPIAYQSQYGGSMQFHLYFSMQVVGGTYLDQFKNRMPYQIIVYTVPVTFTLYDHKGVVLGYQDVQYSIQVNQSLSGTPPAEPAYSIEILGDAHDSRLEFGNINNYVEGVTATYIDALKINANTGYTITVKAIASAMTAVSDGQATMPVSVIYVRLQPGSTSVPNGNYEEIALSNNYQPLFTTADKREGPQFFNITYRTAGNDERLLNARSGVYATTLLYQLVPQ